METISYSFQDLKQSIGQNDVEDVHNQADEQQQSNNWNENAFINDS